MKILFISAVLPYPLYSGGQVRIYNLLKLLSKKHEISLVSFIRNEEERAHAHELSFCHDINLFYRGNAWQPRYIFRSLFGSTPLLYETYRNESMKMYLGSVISNNSFDLIHIEPSYVWLSLPNTTLPVVVSEHNIEYTVYEEYVRHYPFIPLRPALYYDVIKHALWEKRVWKKATHLTTVSDYDASVIAKIVGQNRVTTVPNGVDLSIYTYKKRKGSLHTPTFLFVGYFGWLQNRDALKYILQLLWPIIFKHYPEASLRVVGKNMPSSLRRLILNSPRVEEILGVTNMNDEFHKSDILLAPIRMGGGTKFKIIEAMASGVPVITTSKGALGLNVHNGKEIIIADSLTDQIRGIDELLSNPEYYEQLSLTARTCVEKYYSWDSIAKILDTVWSNVYEKT